MPWSAAAGTVCRAEPSRRSRSVSELACLAQELGADVPGLLGDAVVNAPGCPTGAAGGCGAPLRQLQGALWRRGEARGGAGERAEQEPRCRSRESASSSLLTPPYGQGRTEEFPVRKLIPEFGEEFGKGAGALVVGNSRRATGGRPAGSSASRRPVARPGAHWGGPASARHRPGAGVSRRTSGGRAPPRLLAAVRVGPASCAGRRAARPARCRRAFSGGTRSGPWAWPGNLPSRRAGRAGWCLRARRAFLLRGNGRPATGSRCGDAVPAHAGRKGRGCPAGTRLPGGCRARGLFLHAPAAPRGLGLSARMLRARRNVLRRHLVGLRAGHGAGEETVRSCPTLLHCRFPVTRRARRWCGFCTAPTAPR